MGSAARGVLSGAASRAIAAAASRVGRCGAFVGSLGRRRRRRSPRVAAGFAAGCAAAAAAAGAERVGSIFTLGAGVDRAAR
jgi:hypothetical protein